ncbi:MAG: DNA polymerase III subunit alpha [Prevotellaceae bacterium]|jgi:DNA polymerase-3 subunit alpha|nr:DNA polymerase III subunit alpha [Prevotellaceae bacterium]
MSKFTHLHVHTQYSVLDGASSIQELFAKAKADGQVALAITDHGNMFGVKEFLKEAKKYSEEKPDENGEKIIEYEIKPIVGCEVYVAQRSRFDKQGKADQRGNHLIILAKNKTGYHNLAKLVSLGYIDGFYSRPRIDKEILFQYNEGLVVSTACIGGEIPRLIRMGQMDEAEKLVLEFKEYFSDDFYLEMQRHPTSDPNSAQDVYPKQQFVNEGLIELAKKTGVKLIVTNDVHFVNAEDAEAHDRLICINTGTDIEEVKRMRYTKQEWMKTQAEMEALFPDHPEALANTMEIANKIEVYDINSGPIMPDFPIPEDFEDDDDYLKHLTYGGAKRRYAEITPEIKERIDFELNTIKSMGFPGYFLIVQDFIAAAREMGVAVGPGRGSAAGSVVAYCLRITDIDPIKYDLLFERFLNPNRISMPDIDIDFDDDGRALVLKYVEDKYGRKKVAHIITFGTMAAKSAIRDVARVQKLPLPEADRLAKLVPEGPKINLKTAFASVPELAKEQNSNDPLVTETLKYAQVLEGSVRNIGVHACGIIIGKNDLIEYIPLCVSKDKDTNEEFLVTQYEGTEVEDVGLLKMDFLGLKTLSIIKECIENIRLGRGITIDIGAIPLDDAKTYELYSRGDTVGTFQFESDGMRKWLRLLKPTKFEDLIAMNALYRPGPMDYIPDFVSRKNGATPIVYDLPEQEGYLKDTYGITVYQEQVMLLSQKLAGYTKGQADLLRKAMGKKMIDVMNKMKAQFLEGGEKNGHPKAKLEKIWSDWEAFAQYAFNKSHSTCYSYVAYQTAYLKAHYPAEYMAAVLSRNLSNISEITKFMDECRRMGINVLGPDINESYQKFTVNKEGDIRFGMGAVKNVGVNAVDNIIEERKNGTFSDIFDFVERVNLSAVNKKNIESLAAAGTFDSFNNMKRHQFYGINSKNEPFIDVLIRYGNKVQTDKVVNSNSLFGGTNTVEILKPEIPIAPEWSRLEVLKREKELIGIYLSSHPLDDYKFEIENFTTNQISDLSDLALYDGKELIIAGLISSTKESISKAGKPWGSFVLEDYSATHEFRLFGRDYDTFLKYLREGLFLLVKGTVQERFSYNRNNDDSKKDSPKELEFKIKSINLLGNACDEMIKSLTISMPMNNVTSFFVDELKEVTVNNKGKVELRFKLVDPEDNISVELFSRKFKIAITKDFIAYIQNDDFKYSIN